MPTKKQSKQLTPASTKRIKDLNPNQSLGGVKFKHPGTGEPCYWYSQWGYAEGKAGVFYKKDPNSSRLYPLSLDKLEDALEFEVID